MRGSETVLLVEDEDQVRTVASDILRRQGYQVLEARNAGEGFLACEGYAGGIDLLLSDVVMPQMSGPELAARLAPMRPHMKVLLMSGYTDDTATRHRVSSSGIPFFQKPFTPESLARKVREVLDVHRQEIAPAPGSRGMGAGPARKPDALHAPT
jgi:two-component system cell cycle sensor histidine kinase/response regulator CckA